MSKLVSSVKKVFKGAGKLVKKVASSVNKIHKKLRKSKIYRAALVAGAVYFGGAGLMSMANGGTFMAGVSSAGTSLASAGSSLLSGNFSAAGSHLSAGFSGTTVGAQAASTALAQPLTTQGLMSSTQATSMGLGNAGGANMINGVSGQVATTVGGASSSVPSLATASGVGGATSAAGSAASSTVAQAANPSFWSTQGGGLMGGALVNAGAQTVGGYMNARAQQEAEEDERDRRNYNITNKRYGSDYDFNITSAFTPKTGGA